MVDIPPESARQLRDLCRPGICNLSDEKLLQVSQFVLSDKDLATPAWVDLARELMLQIQWERDARSRRDDANKADARAEDIHQRQHRLNRKLTTFTMVAALGAIISAGAALASWYEQHQQSTRAAQTQSEPKVSLREVQDLRDQLQILGKLVSKLETGSGGREIPSLSTEPNQPAAAPSGPIQQAPVHSPASAPSEESGADKVPSPQTAPPVHVQPQ